MMLSISWAIVAAVKTFSTRNPNLPRFEVILTRTRNKHPNWCDDCYRDPESDGKYIEDNDFPREEWTPRPENLTNIPSLENISSLKVAIALWYNLNIPVIIHQPAPEFIDDDHETHERHSDFGCLLLEKVLASVEKLSVPKSLTEQIANQVTSVGRELEKWARYHYWKVFFNLKTIRFVYILIYFVIWHPDGTINERQTAKNLLMCDQVSKIEKFYLSCLFCLEDEIKRIWKSLSKLDRDMVGCVKFSKHPLIFYWTCFCINTIEEPRPCDESIYNFMFRNVNNWPAKEYFFERMNEDEQIESVNFIVFYNQHLSSNLNRQTLLLRKLSHFQRLRVFMCPTVAPEIMKNYARFSRTQDIIRTWNEIQFMVDRDQFVSIFQALLAENVDVAVLQNIWIEDSDEFRKYLLKSSDFETIVNALEKSINCDENHVCFILVLNAPASVKQSIKVDRLFFKYCVKLMIRRRISMLDKLLDAYFPTQKAALLFSKYLREDFFGSYCEELITEGDLNLLDPLINLFIPSAEESAEFKLNLTKQQFFRDHCEKLIDRIVKGFAGPTRLENLLEVVLVKPELILEFKKNLVDDSKTVKNLCFKSFRYGSEKDVNNFIDGVFDEMLKGCIFSTYDPAHRLERCTFRSDYGFFFLDQFLEWCLKTPEEIRKYKLSRVHDYMEIDIIRMLLEKKEPMYLKAIMRWFFKGNASDIEKFKSKNRGRKILLFL